VQNLQMTALLVVQPGSNTDKLQASFVDAWSLSLNKILSIYYLNDRTLLRIVLVVNRSSII